MMLLSKKRLECEFLFHISRCSYSTFFLLYRLTNTKTQRPRLASGMLPSVLLAVAKFHSHTLSGSRHTLVNFMRVGPRPYSARRWRSLAGGRGCQTRRRYHKIMVVDMEAFPGAPSETEE